MEAYFCKINSDFNIQLKKKPRAFVRIIVNKFKSQQHESFDKFDNRIFDVE